MGLASLIRKNKRREGCIRILVLGLDGAGKSSLVSWWRYDEIEKISNNNKYISTHLSANSGNNIVDNNVNSSIENCIDSENSMDNTLKKYSAEASMISLDKSEHLENTLDSVSLSLKYTDKSVNESVCGKEKSVNRMHEIEPTLGFRIWTVRNRVHLWDVGGQQSIRQYWRNYFESTDALIFVIDSACPERLNAAIAELNQLVQRQNQLSNGIPVLIAANKCDCPNALSKDQIETVIKPTFSIAVENKYSNLYWKVFSTSALTGFSASEALDWLLNAVDQQSGKCKADLVF